MKNLLLFAFFAFNCFSFAQNTLVPGKPETAGLSPERLARIDKEMQEYISKGQLPGIVALIARNGKIVYEKSFGFSDIENKTALKTDHIFRIASQSKAVTALAIMMLWEEGKFLLDDPLSNYIPEFKSPKVLVAFNEKDSTYTAEPAKSEITIRQLLTHSAGIDYAAIGTKEGKSIYFKAGVPSGIGTNGGVLGDKMKILGKLPLKNQPGEKWLYGLNSDVLGYLVEVFSGLTFDEFLRQRIFKPLGMNDTYFYLPKDKQPRLVKLYETKNDKLVRVAGKIYDNVDPDYPNTNGTYFSGGAGLSSTVEDYAKFLQLFLNKGEYNGVRLLSRKTVELMMTSQLQSPITERVGLGFGLETEDIDYKSPVSLGTFNWGGAFNSHYWADPKEKLIGIVFTNVYSSPYWAISQRYRVLVYQSISD
ncbi:MAG TPA: serine hydrolase domain-containing protein [Cyclobacteriaceae bacterium]|nr:serine hydrolase domain-containing protein [Cyclobacteriaceae bacterium]